MSDPFDTVQEALDYAEAKMREHFDDPKPSLAALASLASIEERLRSASRGWTAASTQREGYRKELEKADARVAELEAALREIMEKGAYDADYEIARSALATSEQARTTAEDAQATIGKVI